MKAPLTLENPKWEWLGRLASADLVDDNGDRQHDMDRAYIVRQVYNFPVLYRGQRLEACASFRHEPHPSRPGEADVNAYYLKVAETRRKLQDNEWFDDIDHPMTA